ASKHALEAVNDALRQELAPHGVEVALIQPGQIRTPIWQKSLQRAQKNLEKLPEEGRKLYGKMIDSAIGSVDKIEKHALPVGPVAEAVYHALTARKPKTRYLVAKNAGVVRLMTHLPDRVRDTLIFRWVGL
ncbi:MAG: SDR family NAD(P)-dependent oxidoreductase, partial [Bacteroidia bacterium]|nr:SDR family NAD(P)-dependent oxidoreductase [Bacteroidia bacterium]MDW8333535.1 SDR family NAD(P)-dependent oxidoreductase [Bacteroidia bacterium]